MLYMVVETFKNAPEIYSRLDEKGRMMPEGLKYISSWVDEKFEKCFQLMETEDFELFKEWTKHWDDLAVFEIFPVITSLEAKKIASDKSKNGNFKF